MNNVQETLAELKVRGWTLAAIADELEMHWNTVNRWDKGSRYPDNPKPVILALDALLKRRRIPKKKRYKRAEPT